MQKPFYGVVSILFHLTESALKVLQTHFKHTMFQSTSEKIQNQKRNTTLVAFNSKMRVTSYPCLSLQPNTKVNCLTLEKNRLCCKQKKAQTLTSKQRTPRSPTHFTAKRSNRGGKYNHFPVTGVFSPYTHLSFVYPFFPVVYFALK